MERTLPAAKLNPLSVFKYKGIQSARKKLTPLTRMAANASIQKFLRETMRVMIGKISRMETMLPPNRPDNFRVYHNQPTIHKLPRLPVTTKAALQPRKTEVAVTITGANIEPAAAPLLKIPLARGRSRGGSSR